MLEDNRVVLRHETDNKPVPCSRLYAFSGYEHMIPHVACVDVLQVC